MRWKTAISIALPLPFYIPVKIGLGVKTTPTSGTKSKKGM